MRTNIRDVFNPMLCRIEFIPVALIEQLKFKINSGKRRENVLKFNERDRIRIIVSIFRLLYMYETFISQYICVVQDSIVSNFTKC